MVERIEKYVNEAVSNTDRGAKVLLEAKRQKKKHRKVAVMSFPIFIHYLQIFNISHVPTYSVRSVCFLLELEWLPLPSPL